MTREPGDLELVARDWHRLVFASAPSDGCARVFSLIGPGPQSSFVDSERIGWPLVSGESCSR